jgi:hypothetical protein
MSLSPIDDIFEPFLYVKIMVCVGFVQNEFWVDSVVCEHDLLLSTNYNIVTHYAFPTVRLLAHYEDSF